MPKNLRKISFFEKPGTFAKIAFFALCENSEPGRSYTLDASRLRVAPSPPFSPLALSLSLPQGCFF